MARVYYYKLRTDDGGAPCVQNSLLSLAICKPMIRSTASEGDLIFGFSANSLHSDNRLLYIARVTHKIPDGKYYEGKTFSVREDCIYQKRGNRFKWRPGSLHHGEKDLVHDLGRYPNYDRANVLLSADFRYFGMNGSDDYKSRYPLIKDAVEHLGIGHRVHHDDSLRKALLSLMNKVWKDTRTKVIGKLTSMPRPRACHRNRSCGVLNDFEKG